MIHDAQHTVSEFLRRSDFGHSTIDYAVGLAEVGKAKRLILFHHDPSRTGAELTEILINLESEVTVEAATEGQVLVRGAGDH